MKRIIALFLAVFFAFSLVSCFSYNKSYEGKPKDFTVEELTITLTDEFMKMSFAADGYTAAYGATDTTLLVLKETFKELNIDNSYTAEDYAWAVHDGYSTDYITDVYTEDGLVCFEFGATTDEGDPLEYLAVCYKAEDAFWLLLFATDEPIYDEYRFYYMSWAKTVRFS